MFLPPSSPIDPATVVDAPMIDYATDDYSSLLDELPGKQNPFPSPRYRLSVYIILALGIAAVATLSSYSAAYAVFVACF